SDSSNAVPSVTIEVAATPILTPATTAPVSVTPALPEQSVLIVEDDPDFNRILQGLAEAYGFATASAHTAAEAFAYLENHVPGSVILDLGLPDAPGQQLLEHLKSHSRTHAVPVHVITGNVSIRKSDLP